MTHRLELPGARRAPRWLVALGALALAGCASYRPLALPAATDLVGNVAALKHVVPPARRGAPPERIDVGKPLGIDQIGVLAILNDPDLLSERGAMSAARAGLLQASLLPNPSVGLGYAALIGGPGTSPAYTASISQDIDALVTYRARVRSARARVSAVNAGLLWREWQVAQKARLLALDLYWGGQASRLSERELGMLSKTISEVRRAAAAGSLDLTALAPLLAAKASAQQSLTALRLDQLRNWQALDALLGMLPSARFRIARPDFGPLPGHLDARVAKLASYRPDLIALRLGYRSSEQAVRAAVLGQFPALVIGLSWSSDTSEVRSAGPNVTFDLPIFDRNQGRIAQARATRLLLHEEYQARLDRAVAGVDALRARIRRLTVDAAQARRASAAAEALAKSARAAYADGNLDQRVLTDYETTALRRRIAVYALRRALGEDRIALAVELGLGLPETRIAPPDATRRS